MKKYVAVILAIVFSAGAAVAKDLEVAKKAGDFDVVVKMDKNPPVTGDNGASVSVKDAAGKPVKDAKVVIEYSMPPMPGMPPMNYKTDAVQKGEGYGATLGLSMAGPWNIMVKVQAGGKTGSMKFTIDAK